jgi:hypothetical protein
MRNAASNNLSLAMNLNWKSVNAAHVTRACEAVLNSPGAKPKAGGLIVIYKDKSQDCTPDSLLSRQRHSF